MRRYIHAMMIGAGTLACMTMYINYGHSYTVPNDGTSALPLTVEYYIADAWDADFLEDAGSVPTPKHKPVRYTQKDRDALNALFAKLQ